MKKQLFFLILMGAFITAYSQQPLSASPPFVPVSKATPVQFSKSQNANTGLTYIIIDAPDHTFGYNIYMERKLVIHQTAIPGVAGNNGFKTKKNAATIARLVIEKLHSGKIPPAVSISEMKKLNVIK